MSDDLDLSVLSMTSARVATPRPVRARNASRPPSATTARRRSRRDSTITVVDLRSRLEASEQAREAAVTALEAERARCASICERMIVGGRAWTEEQAIAAEVLGAAAKNIRDTELP